MSLAIVQSAAKNSTGAGTTMAVTFGSAPTNGNLLFAIFTSILDAPSVGSGWTQSGSNHSSTGSFGTQYSAFYYKYAGASESTAQAPNSANCRFGYMQVWEISGVSGTFATDHASDTASGQTVTSGSSLTYPTAVTGAANELLLATCEVRFGGSTAPALTQSGGSATTDNNPSNSGDASDGIGFHQAFPTNGTTTPAYTITFNGTGGYGTPAFSLLKGSAAATETATVAMALSGVSFAGSSIRTETATAAVALKGVSFGAAGQVIVERATVTMSLNGVTIAAQAFDLNAIAKLRQFHTFG